MPIMTLIQQIVIVFLEILVGYIAGRCHIILERDRKFLSNFIMTAIIPCSMIASTGMETGGGTMLLLLESVGLMIVYNVGCILCCSGLCRVQRLNKEHGSIFVVSSAYANYAFIGIPLATSVLGDIGMVFAVASIMVFNVLFYTHGVRVFQPQRKPTWRDFVTPLNISTVIMVVMLLTRVHLPSMLQSFFSAVGACTTPLMLICTGTLLADTDLKVLVSDFFLYKITGLRCLLLPLAFMLLLRLFPLDPTMCMGLSILSACPTAVSISVVAMQNDVDPRLAAQSVAHSTLFSLLTLPVIMFIAGKLFL